MYSKTLNAIYIMVLYSNNTQKGEMLLVYYDCDGNIQLMNDPMVLVRQCRPISDLEEQSDQGVQRWHFRLHLCHLLEAFFYNNTSLLTSRVITAIILVIFT